MDDINAIRNEHGGGIGVYKNPVERYNGPIHESSDAEAIRRDHGTGIGVPVDGMIIYGTNNPELKDIVNNLIHSNGVNNLSELISKLPNESIKKIIEIRFRNSIRQLRDTRALYGNFLLDLTKNITLDLEIIKVSLLQKRDLFSTSFNTSYIAGKENMESIFELINDYEIEIQKSSQRIYLIDGYTNTALVDPKTDKPYDSYNYINELKEEAKNLANELGIEINQISI